MVFGMLPLALIFYKTFEDGIAPPLDAITSPDGLPGVELVLEAFEGYWRKTPSIKRLVFRVLPDETTRAAALKNGEVEGRRTAVGIIPTEEELDLTGLMRCADLALYSAKARGKGQLVRYDAGLHARMLDRLALRSELQRAVEANELDL